MAAEQLIAKSTSKRLKLLCFGDRQARPFSIVEGDRNGIASRCYVFGYNIFGEEKMVVKKVTPRTAQYHVPDCSAWHIPYADSAEDE